jgi:hypothetical protein
MATQKVHPLDRNNLWHDYTISDPTHGDLIISYPVQPDGQPDLMRQPRFRGEALLNGQIRLGFQIDAATPEEAFTKWAAACSEGVKQMESDMLKQRIITGGGRKPSGGINGAG